jgi:hypothetical protein
MCGSLYWSVTSSDVKSPQEQPEQHLFDTLFLENWMSVAGKGMSSDIQYFLSNHNKFPVNNIYGSTIGATASALNTK